jgi:predicted nucleic acid-binding protein
MDLMLALTEDGIPDVMWSDDLLDEWERVIVRERHRSPDAAAAITATIRQLFADTRIPVESYRGLIAEVDGPDHDDNTHMAAAVAGRVEFLVSWNGKDSINSSLLFIFLSIPVAFVPVMSDIWRRNWSKLIGSRPGGGN